MRNIDGSFDDIDEAERYAIRSAKNCKRDFWVCSLVDNGLDENDELVFWTTYHVLDFLNDPARDRIVRWIEYLEPNPYEPNAMDIDRKVEVHRWE